MDYETLGNNIRKYRTLAKMRQEDLAVLCDCTGTYIGQIEHARSKPSLERVVLIANALGVTVDQLLISSTDNSELVYLREMEMRIKKLPTATKILACEELTNLLAIIERIHK